MGNIHFEGRIYGSTTQLRSALYILISFWIPVITHLLLYLDQPQKGTHRELQAHVTKARPEAVLLSIPAAVAINGDETGFSNGGVHIAYGPEVSGSFSLLQ